MLYIFAMGSTIYLVRLRRYEGMVVRMTLNNRSKDILKNVFEIAPLYLVHGLNIISINEIHSEKIGWDVLSGTPCMIFVQFTYQQLQPIISSFSGYGNWSVDLRFLARLPSDNKPDDGWWDRWTDSCRWRRTETLAACNSIQELQGMQPS